MNNKYSFISALAICVIGSLTQLAHADSFSYKAQNPYIQQQQNEYFRKQLDSIGFVDQDYPARETLSQAKTNPDLDRLVLLNSVPKETRKPVATGLVIYESAD